ncbi:MAG: hypothetical protein ACKPE1_29670, partial [Dolichospermum sp.]
KVTPFTKVMQGMRYSTRWSEIFINFLDEDRNFEYKRDKLSVLEILRSLPSALLLSAKKHKILQLKLAKVIQSIRES